MHVRTAVTLAALVATTGGCSTYDRLTTSDFARQEPEQVVAAAVEAMSDVTSIRVTGQVRVRGSDVLVDIATDDGGSCTATMRTGEGRLALRRIGRQAWIKGDEAFITRTGSGTSLPPGALSRLATSWVRADAPPLLELCDLRTWTDTFARTGTGGGEALTADDLASVTLVEDDELGGDVRAVHFSPDPRQTVWVRSEAPHYVVRVERTGRDGGALSLSDFNLPVDVERPPADEVLRP